MPTVASVTLQQGLVACTLKKDLVLCLTIEKSETKDRPLCREEYSHMPLPPDLVMSIGT